VRSEKQIRVSRGALATVRYPDETSEDAKEVRVRNPAEETSLTTIASADSEKALAENSFLLIARKSEVFKSVARSGDLDFPGESHALNLVRAPKLCEVSARMPTRQGSIRLFQLFGITVFLHWSWFFIALYEIQARSHEYGSYTWNALEYIALFLIVLTHEFGHALACRSVGGRADQIVLWPLGGVAYVSPPMRPGAVLWSIVAGPLVNVILFPIFYALLSLGRVNGWYDSAPNLYSFIGAIFFINTVLLVFNLLPIYPLDGGKILWSLLWFIFGKSRSLMIATVIGVIAILGLIPFIISQHQIWLYIIAAFILFNCWTGWAQARAMARVENAPRRSGYACPACKASPRVGTFWGCGRCRQGFDIFETHGVCPHCGAQFTSVACTECGSLRPIDEWVETSGAPPKIS
jgi:Zn-dependent protease